MRRPPPESLDDLTRTAINDEGQTGGPFLESLPLPPSGSAAYRYEVSADHRFRIVGDSHGEIVDSQGTFSGAR